MNLVINKCYGGFSLSPEAVKRLAELQGRPCYFFTYHSGNLDTYIPTTIEELRSRGGRLLSFSAFDIPNPQEVLKSGKAWSEMTLEEKQDNDRLYSKHCISNRPEDRADKFLVRVVEELGEKANGGCAKLGVVDIPDGVDYEIDEYDGIESVHEKHRTWG